MKKILAGPKLSALALYYCISIDTINNRSVGVCVFFMLFDWNKMKTKMDLVNVIQKEPTTKTYLTFALYVDFFSLDFLILPSAVFC